MAIYSLTKDISREVCFRLPHKEISQLASVLALVHPNGRDIIVIKARTDIDVAKLTIDDFTFYSEPFQYRMSFKPFEGKKVILNSNILPHKVREYLANKL
ncbi:hypothetical protein D3C71_1242930 [compost metagenome]